MSAATAHAYLTETFAGPPITLSPAGFARLLDRLRDADITGGAVYDALVAATASEAGATLLSLDRRAVRTYEAIGATFELVTA